MKTHTVNLRLADGPEFRAFLDGIKEFIDQYAWHLRSCQAVDADGDMALGSAPCTCGYDQALDDLVKIALGPTDKDKA